MREILSFKCRFNDSKSINTNGGNLNLVIPQNLLECLLQTLVVLKRENDRLIEKSQLEFECNQNEIVQLQQKLQSNDLSKEIKTQELLDLKKDAADWKIYGNKAMEANRKLIEEVATIKLAHRTREEELRKQNEQQQLDLNRMREENEQIQAENQKLNCELFKLKVEIDTLKKNAECNETLKEQRVCCQQKVHLISEKYEQCHKKLDEMQIKLQNKEILCELQNDQIVRLENDCEQIKANRDELDQRLTCFQQQLDDAKKRIEEQANQLRLYSDNHKCQQTTEIRLLRMSVDNFIKINSAYEQQLMELKCKLNLLTNESSTFSLTEKKLQNES